MKNIIKDILALLDESFELFNTDENIVLSGINNSKQAGENEITWLKSADSISVTALRDLRAGLIVAPFSVKTIAIENKLKNNFLFVENPKYVFSFISNKLATEEIAIPQHSSNNIHKDAVMGKNCYIGPNCYIGKCSLGNNVKIIGNVYIFDGVEIGDDVIIQPGVVIGSAGFGYAKNKSGNIELFPHIGGVKIGNGVEIGANTCIDRGALGDTILEDNVKVDNLVHIAHNVVIGKNSFVIANAMIGGSVQVGENSWISPSVSILQQLVIGANALIGVGSVVTKNIPEGKTWSGIPARPLEEFIAIQKFLKDNIKL